MAAGRPRRAPLWHQHHPSLNPVSLEFLVRCRGLAQWKERACRWREFAAAEPVTDLGDGAPECGDIETLAADLPKAQAGFMAASQMPVSGAAFGAKVTTAAWHDKPSYGIVATQDRALNPDLERWMYKRSGAKVTEIKASHAVYISQPRAVAKVIEQAAKAAK